MKLPLQFDSVETSQFIYAFKGPSLGPSGGDKVEKIAEVAPDTAETREALGSLMEELGAPTGSVENRPSEAENAEANDRIGEDLEAVLSELEEGGDVVGKTADRITNEHPVPIPDVVASYEEGSLGDHIQGITEDSATQLGMSVATMEAQMKAMEAIL